MRKLFKSKITFLLAVILLVTVAVASTFALLMVVTQSLRNLFSPPTISCQTTYDDDTDTWTVTNDGDVAVYVRVAVVPYLTNASDKVFWNTPVCTVTYDDTKWSVLGEHGYYYYSKTLAPNETVVFGSAVVDAAAAAQFGFDVSKVVVNAEAFQVGSDDALLDAWGVAYDQESGFSAEGACTHSMAAYVNVNNEYHKYVCSACGYVSSFARHSLTNATNNDDGTHSGTCACGYNISSVAHTVAYEYVDGTNHTAFCTLCDWSETQTCSYTTDPVLDVGGSTYHRRMCACGAGQELAAHTFTYKDNGDGTHSYWCDTETGGCGYVASTADHSSMLTDRSETEHTYSCPSCRYAVSTEHDMQMVSAGESGHRLICVICDYGSTTEPTAHNMTAYTNTGHLNTHIVSCADCGYSVTEEHTVTHTSLGDTYHRVTCSECEYDENIAHTYTYTSNGEEQHTVGCELCTYQSTVDHELEYEQINESTHTVRCKKCPYTATKNHAITYTITADTHTAKCDQCGYTGSASSHTDFEYTSVDGSTHSVTCGVCGYGFTASHTITYTSNSDGHTPKCDICGYTGAATAHDAISYTNKTDTTHTMTCTTCNYTGSATNHTKANYVQNGSSGHTWTCSVCQKSVTEAHDGGSTCTKCGYVAYTYNKQFEQLSMDMQPVLSENDKYISDETVFFIDKADGYNTKSLLYPIDNVISVTHTNPENGHVTTFVEGVDYEVVDGKLKITANSSIPCVGASNYYNASGANFENPVYFMHNGVKTPIYNGEGYKMVQWQVNVDYTTTATWSGYEQTSYYNTEYASFIAKMKAGQNVTVFFYGDSITYGANASFISGFEPYNYSYALHFTHALADLFDYTVNYIDYSLSPIPNTPYVGGTRGTITYVNVSQGGLTSSVAAAQREQFIGVQIDQYGCDLFIMAFGMNDGAVNPAADTQIVDSQRAMLDTVLTRKSNAAIMVVSTMMPNSLIVENPTWNGYHAQQQSVLSGLLAETKYANANAALVCMTSVSQSVLQHKEFLDYTANNINHPNDFFHRIYAQTLFEALVGYENISDALSGWDGQGGTPSAGYPVDATIDTNFNGYSTNKWGGYIEVVEGVNATKGVNDGDKTISGVQPDDTMIAIKGWMLSASQNNRIVFSLDGSTWYAAEQIGSDPIMSNPSDETEAETMRTIATGLSGVDLSAAPTTNARFLAHLDLTGCEGYTVTIHVAMVNNENFLTEFLILPNVTIPSGGGGGGGGSSVNIVDWTTRINTTFAQTPTLYTHYNFEHVTVDNTGTTFALSEGNTPDTQFANLPCGTGNILGVQGWMALDSNIVDVGYYWDSNSANITWQGHLGGTNSTDLTNLGGVRFFIQAPASTIGTGNHTAHYVARLADGTIISVCDWSLVIS